MINKEEEISIIDTTAGKSETVLMACEKFWEAAGEDISSQGEALNDICQELFEMNNPIQLEIFIKYLSAKCKLPKKLFKDKINSLDQSSKIADAKSNPNAYPEGVDRAFVDRYGYFEHLKCYWFTTSGKGHFKASNFTINPLFHIYSKTDNKRMIEITNETGYSSIIDIPSKSLISLEQFKAACFAEGNYAFHGSNSHLMKILENIMEKIPRCNELKTLGYQREGFYAFANGIFSEGTFKPVDDMGITTHKKSMYWSPSFSSVYDQVRADDDIYENDRYFIFKQAQCTFAEWSQLMLDVYRENGMIAISYIIAAIFRDLIYEKYKIFPHLFLFGEKQSGKSQLSWSMSNFFFAGLPAFNLNSGTQVGFFRRLQKVVNSIASLEEYTNDIDPKRNQGLKSAYDGMGHEKGTMTKDNRTETTKVNSALTIAGQYLPTSDDNALFTRSILLEFEKQHYSEDQVARYDRLKSLELAGLSSLICNILPYRGAIDAAFAMEFSTIMDKLKDEMNQESLPFDERLVRNFCCILTPIKIILDQQEKLPINFSYKVFYDLCKDKIAKLSKMISSSEAVASFWHTVAYMFEANMIASGVDFDIKTINSELKVKDKNGNEVTRDFKGKMQKLLFIRFTKIHPLYQEAHRKQTGKNGVDMVSILHYFKTHKSFVGHIQSWRFDNANTSAYVFKYGDNELGINLEHLAKDEFSDVQPIPRAVPFLTDEKLPF